MAENAQTDQDPDAFCDNLTDRVASAVMDGTYDRAIFVCGTGFGVCILANKVPGIRAALVGDSFSAGKAAISKSTQLILIGACRIASELAKTVVDSYFAETFNPNGRSATNVAAIDAVDAADDAR